MKKRKNVLFKLEVTRPIWAMLSDHGRALYLSDLSLSQESGGIGVLKLSFGISEDSGNSLVPHFFNSSSDILGTLDDLMEKVGFSVISPGLRSVGSHETLMYQADFGNSEFSRAGLQILVRLFQEVFLTEPSPLYGLRMYQETFLAEKSETLRWFPLVHLLLRNLRIEKDK